MTENNHQALMHQLAQHHQAIADLIQSEQVVYLDVPFYRNVGDLLIMQGTLKFFERYHLKVRFAASWFNTPTSRIKPDDTLLFQGGGNLGDLYFGCQHLRELLIPKFKRNRIIILPQSIHFKDDANYKQCCEAFRQHPDLHLFVRDRVSYELALNMTPHVYLMPDMAHQLYPLQPSQQPQRQTLGLLRQDDEVARQHDPVGLATQADWNTMFHKRDFVIRWCYRFSRLSGKLGFNPLLGPVTTKLWFKAADTLVQDAIRLYSNHQDIITDRLHGHILACLLDKPHRILDNSYGKNSRYTSLWTEQSSLVQVMEAEK